MLLFVVGEARVEGDRRAVRLRAEERARGELAVGVHQQAREVAQHRFAPDPCGELTGDIGGAQIEGPVGAAETLVGFRPAPRLRNPLGRVFAGQEDGAVPGNVSEGVVGLEGHGRLTGA